MAHEFTIEVVKDGNANRVRITAPTSPTMFGTMVGSVNLLTVEARDLARAISAAADKATALNNTPKKFYQ